MWQLKPFSHAPLSVSSNCKNLKHKIRNKIYYKQMGLFGFEWLTQFFIFLPKAIFINFFYGGDTSRQLQNSPYNSTQQKCLCIIILSKQFYKNWKKITIFRQQLTFYHPNVFCFLAIQFCTAWCYTVSVLITSLGQKYKALL